MDKDTDLEELEKIIKGDTAELNKQIGKYCRHVYFSNWTVDMSTMFCLIRCIVPRDIEKL